MHFSWLELSRGGGEARRKANMDEEKVMGPFSRAGTEVVSETGLSDSDKVNGLR